MSLPSYIEIVKIEEFQENYGSYNNKRPAVKIQIRNLDSDKHKVSVQLHKVNSNNIIVETNYIIFWDIPAKSTKEEHANFHDMLMNENPGTWKIVSVQVDGEDYFINAIELKTVVEKSCFVATAVYQNYNHPCVFKLRTFRDNYLVHKKLGKLFIRKYNIFGPILANFVEKHSYFRPIFKFALSSVIFLIDINFIKFKNRKRNVV